MPDVLLAIVYGLFAGLIIPAGGYLASIERIQPNWLEEEVRHSVQKERRICDTLEPVMNSHRLCIDKRVIEKDYESTRHLPPEKALRYQMMYQMSRVTRQKGALAHDDRLDVLAIAVNYWTEQMAQDADKAMATRADEKLRKELDDFVDGVLGRKSKPLSWF